MSFEQNATDQRPGVKSNELEVRGVLDASRPQTVLHLTDGRSVALPTELLLGETGTPESGRPWSAGLRSEAVPRDIGQGYEQTIPLVAEQIVVGKQTVATGAVRLRRGTETYTDTAGIDLMRIGWEVERVAVGEIVPDRPEIREEGDVTVFPLVEERLVARREYFLVEEVRVRRVATTTPRTATLELTRDVLTVEREDLLGEASQV